MTIQVLNSQGQIKGQNPSMVQLYDNTASGAIASWDISSISQAYNHLRLVLAARGDFVGTTMGAKIRFNNDSTANYDDEYARGGASTTSAAENLAVTSAYIALLPGATASAGRGGYADILVPNYTGAVFQKHAFGTNSSARGTASADVFAEIKTAIWRSTAAINRITVITDAGNFITGSRLTIYGLL